jgi:hypothetical protein
MGKSVVPWRRRVAFRSQDHPRDARPKRHQHGLGLAHALGEDQDRLAGTERRGHRAEHGHVLCRVAARILPTVNWERPGQAQERRQDRMAKERRLRDGPKDARYRRQKNHRVDERVPVIRDDDEGPGAWHTIRPHDLDAMVEEAHERAGEPTDQGGTRLTGLPSSPASFPLVTGAGEASVRRDTAWQVATTVPSASSTTVIA